MAKDESSYQGKGESIESSNVTLNGVFMPLQSNNAVEIKMDSTDKNLDEKARGLMQKWFTKVPVLEPSSSFTAKEVKSK